MKTPKVAPCWGTSGDVPESTCQQSSIMPHLATLKGLHANSWHGLWAVDALHAAQQPASVVKFPKKCTVPFAFALPGPSSIELTALVLAWTLHPLGSGAGDGGPGNGPGSEQLMNLQPEGKSKVITSKVAKSRPRARSRAR